MSGKNIDSDIVKVLDLIRNSLNRYWLKERIDKILNGEFKTKRETKRERIFLGISLKG